MKKILFAMLATILALCFSSCEPTYEYGYKVTGEVAVHPDMLRYFNVSFCYTDPAGQPVTIPITNEMLQPLDPKSLFYSDVEKMLTARNCPNPESFLREIRYFSFGVEGIFGWTYEGTFSAEKKEDAPLYGRCRVVNFLNMDLQMDMVRYGYFCSGGGNWSETLIDDKFDLEDLEHRLNGMRPYTFRLFPQ